MSNRAWVTLATNDSYGLGALVVAHSLRRSGSIYPAVVLITPSVTEAMSERLRAVFAEVVVVDVLDSRDAAHLALLQRPELGITFTKIHCWNLTQYEKCVFLDADTLIVQNCDELFEREELSAAPDVGWPDCFNSGVFVFKPSADTFSNLIAFATERGSFDGGDQGLLNSYFSDWAQGDTSKRLPFLYNVTSAAFYSYIPALKHYGQNLKIIHFIGAAKPWLQPYNWQSGSVDAPSHLQGFLQLWWDLFVGQVHSQLDTAMEEFVEDPEAILPEETVGSVEPIVNYSFYEPKLDPTSEFPWHHPNKQVLDADISAPEIDMSQFHDPWDIYRGNIPINTDDNEKIKKTSEEYQDIRKNAWDYTYSQPNTYRDKSQNVQYFIDNHILDHRNDDRQFNIELSLNRNQINIRTDLDTNSPQHFDNNYSASIYNHNSISTTPHSDPEPHNIIEYHDDPLNSVQNSTNISDILLNNESQIHKHHVLKCKPTRSSTPLKNRIGNGHVYTVMMDHVKMNQPTPEKETNGYESDTDSDIDEEITPRHPYDGFYLRHRMTIDSHGHKICSHDIPLQPPSTPSENSDQFEDALEEITHEALCEDNIQTGVAGNLARVVPGAPAQQEAVDELARRQGWEAGNIDYMGADSFDNIWAKISQTLSQPPSSPSDQQEPSKDESKPESISEPPSVPVSVEIAKEALDASLEKEVVVPTESEPVAPSSELLEPSSEKEVVAPTESEPVAPSSELLEPSSDLTVHDPKDKTVELTPEQTVEVTSTNTSDVTPDEAVDVLTLQAVEKQPENAVIALLDQAVDIPPEQIADVISEQAVEISSEQAVKVPAEKAVEVPVEQVAEEAHIKKDAVETQEETKVEEAPVEIAETTPVPLEESTVAQVPVLASDASEVPAPMSETADAPGKIEEIIPVPVEAAVVDLAATADCPPTDSKVQTEPEAMEIPVAAIEALKNDDVPVPAVAPVIEKVTTDQLASAPVASIPEPIPAPEAPKPAESSEKLEVVSDSPPLANTPSKEEIPVAPAAKSEERRKPAGKLQLRPPQAADPVLTPDSELEDAAALAQSIIASELPELTSVSPPPAPSPTQPPIISPRLSVQEPVAPPPAGSVSLSQIGVKPKPSTAAQIESSVSTKSESASSTPESPKTADAPKPADPPKAADPPKSAKTPKAVESPKSSDLPKAADTPKAAESLKLTDSPKAAESPKTADPPKTDAPKKKIVKKVVKKDKEGASSGEAPVPPPRKKEKKPKEK